MHGTEESGKAAKEMLYREQQALDESCLLLGIGI